MSDAYTLIFRSRGADDESRSVYHDAKGNPRQNPIYVARGAERASFDAALGATAQHALNGAPTTMCAIEAGFRVQNRALLGPPASFIGQAAIEKRSEMATAALGSMQGRQELLPGIAHAILGRLRRKDIQVDLRGWSDNQAVTTLAGHYFTISLFCTSSMNSRYSPAEAAAAVLAAKIANQLREVQAAAPLYLEVCPVGDYAERAFGWAARVVVDAVPQISDGQEFSPATPPDPASPEPCSYKVFRITGAESFTLRVPNNAVLHHQGGRTTIWNGVLTDAEIRNLLEEVGMVAKIEEVGCAPDRSGAEADHPVRRAVVDGVSERGS